LKSDLPVAEVGICAKFGRGVGWLCEPGVDWGITGIVGLPVDSWRNGLIALSLHSLLIFCRNK